MPGSHKVYKHFHQECIGLDLPLPHHGSLVYVGETIHQRKVIPLRRLSLCYLLWDRRYTCNDMP